MMFGGRGFSASPPGVTAGEASSRATRTVIIAGFILLSLRS